MVSLKAIAISLVLSVVIAGCKETLPIEKLPQTLTLEAYGPTGKLISSRSLPTSDPIYERLQELFVREKEGWQRSFTSYKVGPYVLRSPEITVRCFDDFLVIDYLRLGKTTSMQKQLPNVLTTLGLADTTYVRQR